MIESATVRLRRNSEAPLRAVKERYGGVEGMESALEQVVLAAEGRVRRGQCLIDPTAAHAIMTLLDDISAYGSLGAMGHAEQRVCDRLTPLLTRLTKATLSGGFTIASAPTAEDNSHDESDDGLSTTAEQILELTARAISNCSGGVSCRAADCVFDMCDPHDQSAAPLSVRFGFADYAAGETGAMLWAGAVGLALFLAEHGERWLRGGAAGQLAVIEIGCGPGLASLVLAALIARRVGGATAAVDTEGGTSRGPPAGDVHECFPRRIRLDVTDIAAGVVDEVRESFRARNDFNNEGVRFHICGGDKAGEAQDSCATHPVEEVCSVEAAAVEDDTRATVTVHPFRLDFAQMDDPSTVGAYDLLLASDVVYDHSIAQHVAPAVEALLRPGGTAILCCEAHRDGMAVFTQHIRDGVTATQLEVMVEEPDVRRMLRVLQLPEGLTTSTCSIIVIRKKDGGEGQCPPAPRRLAPEELKTPPLDREPSDTLQMHSSG